MPKHVWVAVFRLQVERWSWTPVRMLPDGHASLIASAVEVQVAGVFLPKRMDVFDNFSHTRSKWVAAEFAL